MDGNIERVDDRLVRIMYQTPGISQSDVKSQVEHLFDHGEAEEALTCAAAIISKLDNASIDLVEALVASAESYNVKITEYLGAEFRNK